MATGFKILGHVVPQDPNDFKSLAELEAQHRIAQFRSLDGLYIFEGVGIFLLVALVAGNPATKEDAFQLQPLAKVLAHLVETLADPQAAVFRIHNHIHAIQHVAFRIMPGGKSPAGDLVP